MILAAPCCFQNSTTAAISFSVTNGACTRCTRAEPEGRYSMSPLPEQCFAPIRIEDGARIHLGRHAEAEMRAGKFALIVR